MQQRGGQHEQVMIVLWSEFLALWLDRTRRRALPLLLATLLLLIPSLPARSACSCEIPGEGHLQMAHHHEGENSEGEDHDHDECEARTAAKERGSVSSRNVGHARPAASSQSTVSRSVTTCCSCPNAPAPSAVAVTTASFNSHADNQTLVYAQVNVLSLFSFHALTGLFGRAGPPDRGKPEHLFLASLAGRAPPVSL